jgi:hypothetical protein
VFVLNSLPLILTALCAVDGPRNASVASLPVPDTEALTPPEPTSVAVASAEFQSEATGGSSGRGRLLWRDEITSSLEDDIF